MKDRLRAFAALLSTLLFLVSIAFFIRSYFHQEWIMLVTYSPVPRAFTIGSFPGRLDLGIDQETTPPPPPAAFTDAAPVPLADYPRWSHYSDSIPKIPLPIHSYYLPQGIPMHQFLGFVWANHTPTPRPGNFSYSFMIPYPFLLLLFAPLPILQLRKLLRRKSRRDLNLCLTCGYDLRAHAPGSNCPECGTPVSPTPLTTGN